MQDILVHMDAEGYYCSEDSILRYIKQLRNELGVDVISGRGRNARYFIGNRLLEKEEMKLIIDSVNASNFIEKSIATKMIDKYFFIHNPSFLLNTSDDMITISSYYSNREKLSMQKMFRGMYKNRI